MSKSVASRLLVSIDKLLTIGFVCSGGPATTFSTACGLSVRRGIARKMACVQGALGISDEPVTKDRI